MNIDVGTLSKRGGREKNQDFYGHAVQGMNGGFVVADGLGGHEGGEIASKIVTEQMLWTFRERPELSTDAMAHMIERAQAELMSNKLQQPRYKDMCSTVTMMRLGFVKDERGRFHTRALFAHVGDSRIYHFREGKLLSQTRDHSVPQALASAGEIREEDIRNHEDRNRLMRALGMDGDIRPTISSLNDVKKGDAFLLCTDGFWEYVLENEMEHLLQVTATSADWLTAMEQMLLSRATGEHDNYTALAVRVLKVDDSGAMKAEMKRPTGKAVSPSAWIKIKPVLRKWSRSKPVMAGVAVCLAAIIGVVMFFSGGEEIVPPSDNNPVQQPGENNRPAVASKLEIGEYVKFGKYNNQPIMWRVIHVTDDGNPMLLSDRVLTYKAFDANDRNVYGISTLRQWLNSEEKESKENKSKENKSEGGFLNNTNFSAKDKKYFITRKNQSMNTPSELQTAMKEGEEAIENRVPRTNELLEEMFSDRVFLLSSAELQEFVLNQKKLGKNAAIANSIDNRSKPTAYWLSSASEKANMVKICKKDGALGKEEANNAKLGVRPAIILNDDKLNFDRKQNGTEKNPFIIQP